MAGIAADQKQFDQTRADYAPYQALGTAAAPHLGNLLGTNGNDAQQGEIDALKAGPLYQQLYQTGADTVLQNASATGGLRGGNTQHSLADFGAETLNGVIAQQLAGYAGATGIGSGATGAVSAFGANSVAQQNALRNQGAGVKAQDLLTRAGINAGNWKNVGGTLDSAISAFLPGGGGLKSLF